MAIDQGTAYTYSGGTWSSGTQINTNTRQVLFQTTLGSYLSCASSSFCMLTNGPAIFPYVDGRWLPGKVIDTKTTTSWDSRFQKYLTSNDSLGAISCPSIGSCTVIASQGYVFTLAHGSWSINAGALTASDVSCPTESFCVAIGGRGAYTYKAQK